MSSEGKWLSRCENHFVACLHASQLIIASAWCEAESSYVRSGPWLGLPYTPGMGKVRPAATRMWPPDSICAARRQQQKRFNVRPFKKSWDTRIYQISFVCMVVSTYFCEQLFSQMNVVKNKLRNRLTQDHLMCQPLTSSNGCSPRFDNIQYTADWILTIVTTHSTPV